MCLRRGCIAAAILCFQPRGFLMESHRAGSQPIPNSSREIWSICPSHNFLDLPTGLLHLRLSREETTWWVESCTGKRARYPYSLRGQSRIVQITGFMPVSWLDTCSYQLYPMIRYTHLLQNASKRSQASLSTDMDYTTKVCKALSNFSVFAKNMYRMNGFS